MNSAPEMPVARLPLAQDGKQHQCQAEGGQGVQRGVQRPLHGQKVRRNAVGQFQLIPRNKCGSDGQCKGQDPCRKKFFQLKFFSFCMEIDKTFLYYIILQITV